MKRIVSLLVLTFAVAACNPGGDGKVGDYNNTGYMGEESLGGSYTDTTNNAPYLLAAAPKFYIGGPYKIDGVQYNPAEDLYYNETGMAGIIPADLNGVQTTNGEVFNSEQMLATSKTLPLPSIVQVTNLENGRTATLRVNNRGPFVNSRVMDVSPAAARALGMTGQTKVNVKILAEQSTQVKNATLGTGSAPVMTSTPATGTGPFSVQVAAFYSEDNANMLANRISYIGKASVIQESGMFKVRINGLEAPAARDAIDRLRSAESLSPGLLRDGRWINADSI